jgi:cobalt-zinc-cadmium efflux system protein
VTADAGAPHAHVPIGRVLAALGVTVLAAAVELIGSRAGGSLFLTADALHLLAHVGIYAVLLLPPRWWHDRWEDASAIAVLVVVAAIAVGIVTTSAGAILRRGEAHPDPAIMLLSLAGLVANGLAAWLLTAPARSWWSFRAALAHELSDGALTVAGLAGAGTIALFGWGWVDPALSLAIGAWLAWWTVRLLVGRARLGRRVWLDEAAG